MTRFRLWTVLGLVICAPGFAGSALAGEPAAREQGEQLYMENCAACHGRFAEGDGPVAAALVVPVPDLTQLSKANKGEFSGETVGAYIDGRELVAAHGDRVMPVWGSEFWVQAGGDDGAEGVARKKIAALVAFVESIQEN